MATSGDANRYLMKDGVRYPPILNPRTAWQVMEAPRSVTMFADTGTEAGLLATWLFSREAMLRNFWKIIRAGQVAGSG